MLEWIGGTGWFHEIQNQGQEKSIKKKGGRDAEMDR
jgi:hypothetical protein